MKINGTNLVLSINTGGGLEPIGFSQDCKLSVEKETANATTKDSAGWDEVITTNGKWSLSGSGLVDFHPSNTSHNIADLFAAQEAGTLIGCSFGVVNPVTGDQVYTGSGYITKLEMNAKDKDLVAYTFDITGTGPLAQNAH